MAQECGAAQPICDVAKKAFGWAQEKPKSKGADPKMVEEANESFRKPLSKRALGTGKAATKKRSKKATRRKR